MTIQSHTTQASNEPNGDALTPDRTMHGLQRDTRLVKEKLS